MKTNQASLVGIVQEKISLTFAGHLAPMDFVKWYEDWYLDELENRQNLVDTKVFAALQTLYSDIGFFEAR